MRSFAGDPDLQAALLAGLDARIERGENLPVEVAGQRLAPWQFFEPDTFALTASVLRVPEDLLRLGAYLFQGFPEDAVSTSDHLTRARSWLAAIPIGVDLSDLALEFAVWRLTDAHDGVISFATRAEVRSAIEAVTDALIYRDEIDRAEARGLVSSLAVQLNAEIREQWQTTRHVADEVYSHLRAIDAARRAIEVGVDPRAPAGVAEQSVFGANGSNIPRAWRERSDAMERWFLARLRAAQP